TPPPPPSGIVSVAGTISLPSGHGLDLASLSVSTAVGVYPVSDAGEFDAEVFAGARTEIGVENAAGDLVLLGVDLAGSVDVSLTSTAEALLYYLVGGMWLPQGQQDTVRSLL